MGLMPPIKKREVAAQPKLPTVQRAAEQLHRLDAIETENTFALHAGQNLPNHTTTMQGKGRYVAQGVPYPANFRDKQAAYRYAAWLITLAEVHLPDVEDCESHDFAAVLDAVRNA